MLNQPKFLLAATSLFYSLTLCPSVVLAETAAGVTIYASPNGSASGSGESANEPLSLLVAQNTARNYAASGKKVTVVLQGGRYEIDQTLKFGAQDSNVTYQGDKGAMPTLSGGVEITGWKKVEDNLYQAKLPVGFPAAFRQLYIEKDGVPLARPSRSRSSFGRIDQWDVDGQGSFLVSGVNWNSDKVSFFSNYPELVVHRFWVQSYVRIRSIHPYGNNGEFIVTPVDLDAGREQRKNVPYKESGQLAYIENDMSLLHDNQWYLDPQTRMIYYRAPVGMNINEVNIIAPRLEHLIEIDNAKNLSFIRLNLQDTTWNDPSKYGITGIQGSYMTKDEDPEIWYPLDGAMVAKNTENLRFANNVIRNTGSSGISLISGTHHTMIEQNHLSMIGGSGIQVYMYSGKFSVDSGGHATIPAMNPSVKDRSIGDVIRDNYVDHIGIDYANSVGIFATFPESLTVEHNEVSMAPYSGISVGWGWTPLPSALKNNHIVGNNVHHVMQRLDDGAGIYLLSLQPGTLISENYVHDIQSGPYAGRRPVVAIYLDDNTEQTTVKNNSCRNNSGNNSTADGVFYRPETGRLNSIEPCRSNDAVAAAAGPRAGDRPSIELTQPEGKKMTPSRRMVQPEPEMKKQKSLFGRILSWFSEN